MRIRPYGDRAVLLDLPADADVAAVRAAVLEGQLPGIEEVVPGAQTLLVRTGPSGVPPDDLRRAVAAVGTRAHRRGTRLAGPTIVLPVHYDGADLDEVAELTGLSRHQVVTTHTDAVYTVAFCGFSPGFAYLIGSDQRLHVPRRASPRPRVPAGSVGVAAEYTGVYPRASPGGWRLLGRTDAALWDLERPEPALLTPGAVVRFESVSARSSRS